MHDVLARAEFRIEGDGGFIAIVGLHEYDPCSMLSGDVAEVLNERRSNALAAKAFFDCEIVYVDFAPLLLEFVEHVGDKPAHDLAVGECDQRNDVLLLQQLVEISRGRPCCLTLVGLAEGCREELN